MLHILTTKAQRTQTKPSTSPASLESQGSQQQQDPAPAGPRSPAAFWHSHTLKANSSPKKFDLIGLQPDTGVSEGPGAAPAPTLSPLVPQSFLLAKQASL